RRHAEAVASLETILGTSVAVREAHATAVATFAKLAELDSLAAKLDELSGQLETARPQAQRQQAAKRLAERLAEAVPLDSQAAVKLAVDAVARELDEQTARRHAIDSELGD